MYDSNKCPVALRSLVDMGYVAGGIMRQHLTHFGMDRTVKADTTPLTVADTAINRMVIERVRGLSSDIDILGEEESDRRDSPWRLVVDPIDGTFPYTWGMPVSTFMVGVLYENQPVMGVIYDPQTNRMYLAEKGKGAWIKTSSVAAPIQLRVSNAAVKSDRPVVAYVSWPGCNYNVLKACHYLEERGVTLVNFCSIGYVEAAVANGEFAGTIFPGPSHHDTAPGHIIVEEAGGKVADIFGDPLNYGKDRLKGHLMSNGHIHELLAEAMNACNSPQLK